MRIVGGELSGRRFGGRVANGTRPTSERVREALASALDSRGLIRDARVLDLYAGTGALAFEALSRGANDALLVESDATAAREIEASIRVLGLDGRARVTRMKLGPRGLGRLLRPTDGAFDLVFADPPYAEIASGLKVLSALGAAGLLAEGAHVVLERATRDEIKFPEHLASVAEYRYGSARVSLLEWTRHAPILPFAGADS